MTTVLILVAVVAYAALIFLLLAFLRGAARLDSDDDVTPVHHERHAGRIIRLVDYDREQSSRLSPAVHEALIVALTALEHVRPQIKGAISQANVSEAVLTLRAVLNRPDPLWSSEKEAQS